MGVTGCQRHQGKVVVSVGVSNVCKGCSEVFTIISQLLRKVSKIVSTKYFFCNSFSYPYSRGEDDEDSVNNNKEGEKAEKEEPEPDENVDFFIH